MSGGNKVIDLWRDQEKPQAAGAQPSAEGETYEHEEPVSAPRDWRTPLALALCGVGAVGWLVLLGFARRDALSGGAITPAWLVDMIAQASAPLALFALVWLLIQRSSRAEASRFARTSEALHAERLKLDSTLALVASRIELGQRDLSDQSTVLMNLGDDAAHRLTEISDTMRKEIVTLSGHTQSLKGSAAAARGDIAVLLSLLPNAQTQTRQMVSALQEAGIEALDKTNALATQLEALSARGNEATQIAGDAASALAERITQMDDHARGMIDLVSQSQSALEAAGDEAATEIAAKVEGIAADLATIATAFADHDVAAQALAERLSSDIAKIETRFVGFAKKGTQQADHFADSLATLGARATDLSARMADGTETAAALASRAQTLLTTLETATRAADETLPEAFQRLGVAADATLDKIATTAPQVSAIAEAAEAARFDLDRTETILARQRDLLSELRLDAASQLSAAQDAAHALAETVRAAGTDARDLAERTGPQLIEALVRTREAARQAADHARTAFADVIPDTARALGEQSKQILSAALTAQVEAQMAEIAQTTEVAVGAAQKATDRLMRQMLTISETSAALEARINEAREEVERSDQTSFARRVALLIESLNSTAIDVSKLLSQDVTDTAWAGYLRGDRGIFTRRAVKLLDASEVRTIVDHYQNDDDFHEQVNRYVHDFEAMLRNVMATREGATLSVTLLSSDTGKLYVALAQAIERLRS